ncbi:hypothetical protein QQZ08_008439 [Neonectria magnoliae]|uniref:Uncharacterized protein n=1 Tax=Neonectria magnoliae TaxID=2732573 RepID=A0ABR1HUA3_9HYPO
MQVQRVDYTNYAYGHSQVPSLLRDGTKILRHKTSPKTVPLAVSVFIVALVLCFLGAFAVVLANRRVRKADRAAYKVEADMELEELGGDVESQQVYLDPVDGSSVATRKSPWKMVRGIFKKDSPGEIRL